MNEVGTKDEISIEKVIIHEPSDLHRTPGHSSYMEFEIRVARFERKIIYKQLIQAVGRRDQRWILPVS